MGERRSDLIIAITIVVVLGLVMAWAFSPSSGHPEAAAPVDEVTDIETIKNRIELVRLGISTSENYVGHRIRLVGATVRNISDLSIRMVEVKMVFTDVEGNPVHEYIQEALTAHQKPMLPGSDYRFEIGFENLPRNWNYRVPVTEITKIGH